MVYCKGTVPRLAGQVVLITGAAGDLGWAIAQQSLLEGASVALCDYAADLLDERGAPNDGRILRICCDISVEEQSRSAVEQVLERWGRLDALVNNAAVVTPVGKVGDLSLDHWRRAMDVNLTGAWLMSKWAINAMRCCAGGGVIINVASQLGSVVAPGRGAYGATKAGLIALTRAIAVDHADEGIRAVSLSPGAVLTSRITRHYGGEDGAIQALAHLYPAGRLGTAEEIARIAVFLMGSDAAFITGTDVRADGGYTAV